MGSQFIFRPLLVLVLCNSAIAAAGGPSVNTVFTWKTVAYGPMDKSENDLVGGYPYFVRNNIIPSAIAYHEKTGMLFIAAPRIKPGVVATLNSVDLYETYHLLSPIWTPYPNAQMNELKPWHFTEPDYGEFAEGDDCDADWKKGPGFCRGHYADDQKNIPDQYLPDEFLSADSLARHKRSYNDTGVKIRISSTFPASDSSSSSDEETGLDDDEGEDNLRITLRTVRQLKSLISVNSLHVDQCDRLWFVDTGVLDYYTGSTNVQPPITVQKPSIWVVDISRKGMFLINRRFELDDHVVPTATGLRGLTVDIPDSCDSGVAYIANALDNRIVVYDMEREAAWYFHDRSMEPNSGSASRLFFRDVHVEVNLGITDLAVGPRDRKNERCLFYTPYSSKDLFAVSTGSLRQQNFQRLDGEAFQYVGRRGPYAQTESLVFDAVRGVLLFAEVQTRSIKCWNVAKSLRRSNIGTIYENLEMKYPAHLSIDAGGNLWVLNNNFPMFLEQSFDHDKFNIHIYRIVLRDVIKHTVCE